MQKLRALLVILLAIIVVETSIIAFPGLVGRGAPSSSANYVAGPTQSRAYGYFIFDQPISNDTNTHLDPIYNSSWEITLVNQLTTSSSNTSASEAQLALAPTYKTENASIPTIIVQERADGLMRIEYFAQDWNKTYGMVLFNSTVPNWKTVQNVTLQFISFGPASAVNPQIAPRPNGNLSVWVGTNEVVDRFPIGWASLSHVFVYGLKGSDFKSGSVLLLVRSLTKS